MSVAAHGLSSRAVGTIVFVSPMLDRKPIPRAWWRRSPTPTATGGRARWSMHGRHRGAVAAAHRTGQRRPDHRQGPVSYSCARRTASKSGRSRSAKVTIASSKILSGLRAGERSPSPIPSRSRPNSSRAWPRIDGAMISRLLSFSVQAHWFIVFLTRRRCRLRRLRIDALAARCAPRHHQQTGHDQLCGAGTWAGGCGKAHHLPDRNRNFGSRRRRKHAILLAQRLRPGDCDLPGRCQSVLHATAGCRKARPGQAQSASGRRTAARTRVHGPWRDFHVQR